MATRFEHLVEINDLERPGVRVLSREELWRGLLVRAERPDLFLASLDGAPALTRTTTGFVRELVFGALRVTDQVHFYAAEVHYEIPPQGDIPRSSLRMTIEEPHEGRLFVRFVYEDERAHESEQEHGARCAAYEAADVDTVATIRWLAESGELDALAPRDAAN